MLSQSSCFLSPFPEKVWYLKNDYWKWNLKPPITGVKEQGGPMTFYHNLTEDLTKQEKSGKKKTDRKSQE